MFSLVIFNSEIFNLVLRQNSKFGLATASRSAKVYKARGCFIQKKYIVRLSEDERCELREVIKKLKGSSHKVRCAQSLLKADVEGTN